MLAPGRKDQRPGRILAFKYERNARRVAQHLTELTVARACRSFAALSPGRAAPRTRWGAFSFTSRLARHSMSRPTALTTHQRMAMTGAQARNFIHITPGAAIYVTPHGAHHAPAHGPSGRAGA